MFCTNCGNKIDENSKFCNNCGFTIEKENSDNNLKKEETSALKISYIFSIAFEVLALVPGMLLLPYVLMILFSNINLDSKISCFIFLIMFAILPIVLIIFNIKNYIKANKKSLTVISVIEVAIMLLTYQFIFLPFPIIKLIYANKINY